MRIIKKQHKIFSKKRHFAEFTDSQKKFVLEAMEKTKTDGGSNLKDDIQEVLDIAHENGLELKYLDFYDNNYYQGQDLHLYIGTDEDFLEEGEEADDTFYSISSTLPIKDILEIFGFSVWKEEQLRMELENLFENSNFSRKRHFAIEEEEQIKWIEGALSRTKTDNHSNLLKDLKEVFAEIAENGLFLQELSSSDYQLFFYVTDDEDDEDYRELVIESTLPIKPILEILGFDEYDSKLRLELEDLLHDLGNFPRKKATRK